MIQTFYNNKNITNKISINNLIIELNLNNFSDNSTIIFNNTEQNWDSWKPDIFNDSIYFQFNDNNKTEKFNINKININNGFYIFDLSNNIKNKKNTYSKTYKEKSLKDILKDYSDYFELESVFYGDFDFILNDFYIENENIFESIEKLRLLFDFYFYILNNKIIFLTFEYISNQKIRLEKEIYINDEYNFTISNQKYKKIILTNGKYIGKSENNNGNIEEKIIYKGNVSESILKKCSANILKEKNRNIFFSLIIKNTDSILYPSEKIKIKYINNDFSGIYLITQNRININKQEQKISGFLI